MLAGRILFSPQLRDSVTISMTCSRAQRIRWNTASLLIRADSQSGCLRQVSAEEFKVQCQNAHPPLLFATNLTFHLRFHFTIIYDRATCRTLKLKEPGCLSWPAIYLGGCEEHHGAFLQHCPRRCHSCFLLLIFQVLRAQNV